MRLEVPQAGRVRARRVTARVSGGNVLRARLVRAGVVAGTVMALVGTPFSRASPARALTFEDLSPLQRRLISGALATELSPPLPTAPLRPGSRAGSAPAASPTLVPSFPGVGCSQRRGAERRVNQDCLTISDPDVQGRGQAQNEPAIAQNPSDPNRLIASYNDYRGGDGSCAASYSSDRGRTWADSTVPTGFTRGTRFGAQREYWQAGGDTALGWDSKGNAYLLCMTSNRGRPAAAVADRSSGIYVFRSQNSGASWNFPGRPVIEHADVAATNKALEDKPYIAVDRSTSSPFTDRLYVTWTEFGADKTAYIYSSFSSDHGESFSPRLLVSASSPLCVPTRGAATPNGSCNANQFSQPFLSPDGTLYVVWANYNMAVSGADNRAQILMARSTDGGGSFSTPKKVASFYDLPDCVAYQGKAAPACIPEKSSTSNSYFRATNYPVGAVNPTRPSQVVVTFGSYINRTSNEHNGCAPASANPLTRVSRYSGVKTPGACNNGILLSTSEDAGLTFSGESKDPRVLPAVTDQPGQRSTDQFFQWAAFIPDGRLAVAYYDRQYGDDSSTGYSDVSLSGSSDLKTFATVKVTSSPLPPPTQFEGTFFGDYIGLSTVAEAHIIWADTRNPNLFLCRDSAGVPYQPPALCTARATNADAANDQDIFSVALPLPAG